MKNLYKLIAAAEQYTAAYCKKYHVTDKGLARAIYTSHLAYLLNSKEN